MMHYLMHNKRVFIGTILVLGLWVYLKDQDPLMMLPLKGPLLERQRVAMETFAAFFIEDRLGAITVPTIVLCGRRDPIIPLCSSEGFHRLPNAELIFFEKSGHDIATDEPQRFQAILQRFISERVTGNVGLEGGSATKESLDE
jgi:pimeloyl-ACP methyl ester carboxylesterase